MSPFVPLPTLHVPSVSVDLLYFGGHSGCFFLPFWVQKTQVPTAIPVLPPQPEVGGKSAGRSLLQTNLEFCCLLPLSIDIRTIFRGPGQWPVALFQFPLSFSISQEIFSFSLWARKNWVSKYSSQFLSCPPHPLKYSFGTLYFIYLLIYY